MDFRTTIVKTKTQFSEVLQREFNLVQNLCTHLIHLTFGFSLDTCKWRAPSLKGLCGTFGLPWRGWPKSATKVFDHSALDEIKFYFLKVGDFIYKWSKKCMFFWLLRHLEVEMSIGYGALGVPNQSIMQLEVGWLASPYWVVCNYRSLQAASSKNSSKNRKLKN